jgi:hypothetical protein
MRKAALVLVGAILLGIAFAAFPVSEIVTEWSAQRASSATQTLQLSSLVAVALAAVALLLMGYAHRFPFPPIGFFASMAILAILAYVGVGMVLGG